MKKKKVVKLLSLSRLSRLKIAPSGEAIFIIFNLNLRIPWR